MPHRPTGVFDAGTSGNIDAAKAACRRHAVLQRAELADASPDAAIMLASHAERIAGQFEIKTHRFSSCREYYRLR